jgi:hypothetical protein
MHIKLERINKFIVTESRSEVRDKDDWKSSIMEGCGETSLF